MARCLLLFSMAGDSKITRLKGTVIVQYGDFDADAVETRNRRNGAHAQLASGGPTSSLDNTTQNSVAKR